MGNCTSKKSEKLLKSTTARKPILKKMDKDQDNNNTKGLSKKIAPFTKGEVTSFGFKRKINSSLPVPVTLTSNGNARDSDDKKKIQNGILKKEVTDDNHSGSSVESLCHHAPVSSTPKMIRKKEIFKQTHNTSGVVNNNNNNNSINRNNENITKISCNNVSNFGNRVTFNAINTNIINNTNNTPANRFGFRPQNPSRFSDTPKGNAIRVERNHTALLMPCTQRVVKRNENVRSKSEGPREAFFKQTLQPAGSMQSVLGQSKANISNIPLPGRFTLQTSHLPRPQFPVRMPDAKAAKTVTNYYRRGGPHSDSNSSKEGSVNDDSGFETQSGTNSTKNDEIFESPGYNVRRRLQTAQGKKLEMKVVGNKFELLDKSEEKEPPNEVPKPRLAKFPYPVVRTGFALVTTGLVEQRTNQYLSRICQNNRRGFGTKTEDADKLKPSARVQDSSSDSSHTDEGFGAESEEEKLYKDRNGTEKSAANYLMNDSYEDEEMLPGEAMAEDFSLSFSSDDETSAAVIRKKEVPTSKVNLETDITPNTIRLDALKLSKQLKSANTFVFEKTKDIFKVDDSLEVGDDETFPSESILEQLSSESDSLGDKGNSTDKKNVEDDIEIEELELDDVKKEINLKNIDLEMSDSELNVDEKDVANTGGSPESPGTPTNASNSLSLSEGRDFLIDDEIADQPQLCLTETYPDCSCQEDVKSCNDKTLTSSGNNDFLSCAEGTLYKNEATQAVGDDEDGEFFNIEPENISPAKKERRLSAGTLSPCDSLTSDDLMMDFESSIQDDTSDRVASVNGAGDELSGSRTTEDTVKDSRPQSSQKTGTGGGVLLKSRTGSSAPGSPSSISNGAPSPLRTRSGVSDDDAVKIDKNSYENMFQDIAGIKKMLLKLKQVLMETDAEGCENGIGSIAVDLDGTDEMSDLRKQVTFLQQQLEEREKTVQNLQLEINRTCDVSKSNGTEIRERCNAATQTDRVRPISTGPSIVQNLPSDSGDSVRFSNNFNNLKLLRNGTRARTELAHDERNTKGFVSVKKSPHVEKIMEKVKELSFKPVEVLEKEEEALRANETENVNNNKLASNGLLNNFKHFDVKEAENCRKPTKNVFKITKIDLVLKSDNYGKNHLTQSNR